jgi:hypothetical protein
MELYFEYDRHLIKSKLMCKYINNCNLDGTSDNNKEFFKTYFGIKKQEQILYYCSQGFYGQLIDIFFNTMGFIFGKSFNNCGNACPL